MVGWHHQLIGHEFGQTLGDSEGQGSLVCCSPWGYKESGTILVTGKQQALRGKDGAQTLQGVALGVSLQESRLH